MKRILSLALAAATLFALTSGCTTGGENENTATPSLSPSSSPSTGEQTVIVDGDTEYVHSYTPINWGTYPVSTVGQDILTFDMVAITKNLPLTGEKVTFDAWWPMGASNYYTNYNEAANTQELENRTNIHIEYFQPSSTDVATSFPLMIASQDYADMIFYAGYYTGGGDKAIEDEVYIRLNELIDEYAPNYKAIREYTDEARRMTITSTGNIWGFYSICKENMPGYMGLNIRKDFMDRAGITERPVTIDDWDSTLGTMLDAIEEAEYAIAIPPTGITRYSAFLSAWDVGSDWYQVDGVAKYGPVEPGFRNYIELMREWYQKGYLRTDFYAVPIDSYNNDITWTEYASGDCVAADGSNTFGTTLSQWGQEEAYGLAVRQPVLKVGDETHIRFDQGVINGEQLAISTACENPELLTKWVDYRYTYEGYLLFYYGIEGLTYHRTGDNHVNITTLITENEDNAFPFTYLFKYVAGVLECTLSDYTNGWCFLDPVYAEEIMVWGEDKCDHNYPNIDLLTAQDGSEFTSLFTDIETYVYETVPKFIIGSIPMEKYDSFVAQIKSMGIDRCIELKQAALDDYNSR